MRYKSCQSSGLNTLNFEIIDKIVYTHDFNGTKLTNPIQINEKEMSQDKQQTLKITEEALPRIILLTYLGLGGVVYNDEIYIDTF